MLWEKTFTGKPSNQDVYSIFNTCYTGGVGFVQAQCVLHGCDGDAVGIG